MKNNSHMPHHVVSHCPVIVILSCCIYEICASMVDLRIQFIVFDDFHYRKCKANAHNCHIKVVTHPVKYSYIGIGISEYKQSVSAVKYNEPEITISPINPGTPNKKGNTDIKKYGDGPQNSSFHSCSTRITRRKTHG